MIYLDNSATTKPNPEVLKSFQQVSERFFANSSSIHQLGGEAEKLLIKAKGQAAQLLQVNENELIFTSGGTEGNNIAIKGIALEHQGRGKHIITTEIEHPSVYEACKSLQKLGFEITYLPVNQNGVISITDLEKAIRDDTILISIMHVNNEIGSIQPIEAIGKLARQYPKLFLHVDAVQSFGKMPLHLHNSGIDLCTMSGHKIHGVKGTGILYINNRTTLFPLFHGGEQEGAKRPGTENLAGIVAMVKAMRLIKEKEKHELVGLYELNDFMQSRLAKMAGVKMNSPVVKAPHIINFSVPGLKPEVIIHMLGEQGIFISTKSACSSKQTDESRIIAACGYGKERSTSALRVSMSYDTTKRELETFLHALEKAIAQLKEVLE